MKKKIIVDTKTIVKEEKHYKKLINNRFIEWLNKGAIPTDTVKNILSKAGIMAKYHNSKQGK